MHILWPDLNYHKRIADLQFFISSYQRCQRHKLLFLFLFFGWSFWLTAKISRVCWWWLICINCTCVHISLESDVMCQSWCDMTITLKNFSYRGGFTKQEDPQISLIFIQEPEKQFQMQELGSKQWNRELEGANIVSDLMNFFINSKEWRINGSNYTIILNQMTSILNF